MSKLLLVTDTDETCGKMGLANIEIHEATLPGHIAGSLRDMGIKEWREYWG